VSVGELNRCSSGDHCFKNLLCNQEALVVWMRLAGFACFVYHPLLIGLVGLCHQRMISEPRSLSLTA